jgi:hypothetical protein
MAFLALAGTVRASDPVGIYALVEKVVLEPEDKPERVQVWGVFRLAKPRAGGDEYRQPAYGYLYYSLDSSKEKECRIEWSDLKKVAGNGQVIAFAGRYQELGNVRKASAKPEKPDTYPVAGGMDKLNANDRMAKELRSIALPAEPADGRDVPDAKVVLRAHAIADKDRENVRYVFEITNATGEKETSNPVEAGEKTDVASWKPKMTVKSGELYTWRVWAVAGDWKGPSITATFKGKSAG